MACCVPKQSWAIPRAPARRQWPALSALATTGHVVSTRSDATWWSGGGKAVRRKVNMGKHIWVKALKVKEGVNCNSVFLSIRAISWLSSVKHWRWGCPGYFCFKAKAQWAIYWGKSCNLSDFSSSVKAHGSASHDTRVLALSLPLTFCVACCMTMDIGHQSVF